MLLFPLPAPLKNNLVLVRAGECFADAQHVIETNPVKKLRQDNALTAEGREQAKRAAAEILKTDFLPTFIWASNTERAYETAAIIAKEVGLGQNRIVPEYSFLDARAAGAYEGKPDASWEEIHKNDEALGTKYRPPATNDGTPSESVADVLVRGNQLVSTIESMYSGENVIIIAPDSDNLSILAAALSSEDPDEALLHHASQSFKNGEMRFLSPVVKKRELLVTGQTQTQADASNRKYKALRLSAASRAVSKEPRTWKDLWHLAVDNES
jgi:broad specificity phosphatase PhoE